MYKWIKFYNEADKQTKYFILNWIIYGMAIIITTAYCYGRLDFVRSTKPTSTTEAPNKSNLMK